MALLWLAALTGLQAHHDLTQPTVIAEALASASPNCADEELLDGGPALPPPVQPHRGPTAAHPHWLRRFALRGPLSYVRLGLEILRSPDLTTLVRRAIRWLGLYLWHLTPFWSHRQQSYRLKHWWPLPT